MLQTNYPVEDQVIEHDGELHVHVLRLDSRGFAILEARRDAPVRLWLPGLAKTIPATWYTPDILEARTIDHMGHSAQVTLIRADTVRAHEHLPYVLPSMCGQIEEHGIEWYGPDGTIVCDNPLAHALLRLCRNIEMPYRISLSADLYRALAPNYRELRRALFGNEDFGGRVIVGPICYGGGGPGMDLVYLHQEGTSWSIQQCLHPELDEDELANYQAFRAAGLDIEEAADAARLVRVN